MLIVLLCALLLDYFFGEPKKYHPLVAFGQFANWLEERLNETLIKIKSETAVELSSEFIIESTEEAGSKSSPKLTKMEISQQKK